MGATPSCASPGPESELEARSSLSDSDPQDAARVAEALDLARRQAGKVLDRGLPAVGAVNLVPYRRRSALMEGDEPMGGAAAFRRATADYLDDLYHPLSITGDRLRQIMPGAGAKADEYAADLESAMTLGGVLTPSQRAAFLGQVAQETGNLRSLRESLHYPDAQRAANIFYRTFKGNPEKARPYLRNSEKMANHVYQGLTGNGDEASGDGYAYRGGGFLQVTGRNQYRELGLEGRPEEMDRPDVAARASVDHWQQKNLNGPTFDPIESRAAFDKVTKAINPAMLGGEARWKAYRRGLGILSKPNGTGR